MMILMIWIYMMGQMMVMTMMGTIILQMAEQKQKEPISCTLFVLEIDTKNSVKKRKFNSIETLI